MGYFRYICHKIQLFHASTINKVANQKTCLVHNLNIHEINWSKTALAVLQILGINVGLTIEPLAQATVTEYARN